MTVSPRSLLVNLTASLFLVVASSSAAETPRLDLDDNSLAPEWLFLEADHRLRFELLNDSFRVTRDTHQTAFLLRTRVRAGIRPTSWLLIAGEFQDARVQGTDASIRLGTSIVNETDLLRAYVELKSHGPFGGQHTLQAGRLTLDVGDRRLVARNRFRNSSNAFTGVDWAWRDDEAHELRLFWTMPVERHATKADRESTRVQFFGGLAAMNLPIQESESGPNHRLELFSFRLIEDDTVKHPTRNRRITTTGYRLFRKPSAGAFDYQLESVVQTGNMKASSAPGLARDNHRAYFHHVEIGYRFDARFHPRIVVQYDYASGDRNGQSSRFDTLYGARRFDFGPTSIYGPFARANLNSPGVRAQFEPAPGFTSFVAVRPFWRASTGDAWTTASPRGLGAASKYLGTQAEIRVRWDAVPQNVRVEAGYAHLFKGHVAKSGPTPKGDSDYFYAGASLHF